MGCCGTECPGIGCAMHWENDGAGLYHKGPASTRTDACDNVQVLDRMAFFDSVIACAVLGAAALTRSGLGQATGLFAWMRKPTTTNHLFLFHISERVGVLKVLFRQHDWSCFGLEIPRLGGHQGGWF